MASRNRNAMILAFIAGILLLIAGVNGIAAWETVQEFVSKNIIDNSIVHLIFTILIFIASLGGIAVIIGGYFLGKDKVRTGKFFISLGAGLGLIGLIISLWIAYSEGNFTIGSFFSIGTIGLILSIVARFSAKKP